MKWDIDEPRWRVLNSLKQAIDNAYANGERLGKKQVGAIKDILDRLIDLHLISDEEAIELINRLRDKGFKPRVDLTPLIVGDDEE